MYTAQNPSDVHPTEEHLFALLAAQPRVDHTMVARRRNALRQAMAAALAAETTEGSSLVSETDAQDTTGFHGPASSPGECRCAS